MTLVNFVTNCLPDEVVGYGEAVQAMLFEYGALVPADIGILAGVGDIEMTVATFFGLSPADLHSSRKSRTIALARNVAMLIARERTDLSFPEIARLMGNKNHTTVLLACRRMRKILDEKGEVTWQSAAGPQSSPLRALIERLEQQLQG